MSFGLPKESTMITQTPPEKMTAEETATGLRKMWNDFVGFIPGPDYAGGPLDLIRSAILHLEGAQADKGWQPMETAPHDKYVLVACHDDGDPLKPQHMLAAIYCDGMWVKDEEEPDDTETWPPTHWRPLPEPPVSAMAAQTEGERP